VYILSLVEMDSPYDSRSLLWPTKKDGVESEDPQQILERAQKAGDSFKL